jgi:hypothetical protein
MIARTALYIVISWLLAAHFLRMGDVIAVALCLAAPLLFLVRRRWSLLLLQWLAYVAAAVWLAKAWEIVATRWSSGEPWLRAAAILVGVAAVNMLAGGLLRSRTQHGGSLGTAHIEWPCAAGSPAATGPAGCAPMHDQRHLDQR